MEARIEYIESLHGLFSPESFHELESRPERVLTKEELLEYKKQKSVCSLYGAYKKDKESKNPTNHVNKRALFGDDRKTLPVFGRHRGKSWLVPPGGEAPETKQYKISLREGEYELISNVATHLGSSTPAFIANTAVCVAEFAALTVQSGVYEKWPIERILQYTDSYYQHYANSFTVDEIRELNLTPEQAEQLGRMIEERKNWWEREKRQYEFCYSPEYENLKNTSCPWGFLDIYMPDR